MTLRHRNTRWKTMRCPNHRHYMVYWPPQTDCTKCWQIWDMRCREDGLELPLQRSMLPPGTVAEWKQGGAGGNTYIVCVRQHIGRQSILVSVLEPFSIVEHTSQLKRHGDTAVITARNLKPLPPKSKCLGTNQDGEFISAD